MIVYLSKGEGYRPPRPGTPARVRLYEAKAFTCQGPGAHGEGTRTRDPYDTFLDS